MMLLFLAADCQPHRPAYSCRSSKCTMASKGKQWSNWINSGAVSLNRVCHETL